MTFNQRPAPQQTQKEPSAQQYQTATEFLQRALKAESRREYDDGAVKGGLDRLLIRIVSEHRLPPGSPLASTVSDLSHVGYASLPPEGRAQWVTNLITIIRSRNGSAVTRQAAAQAPSDPLRQSAVPVARSMAKPPAKSEPTQSLDSPAGDLPGMNRNLAARLRTLEIETVRDLLYHFPHRYDDFSRIRPIAELVPGEQQTLVATIWTSAEKQMGRRRKGTELIVGDRTGNLRIVFFNQPWLSTRFRAGSTVFLSGRVTVFQNQRQMDSPEWELLDESELAQAVHTGRLVPVYPLTAGLNARSMRRIVRGAVDRYGSLIRESLPAAVLERHRLMALPEAVRQMHYPDCESRAGDARRRLAFDELLALELAVLSERRRRQDASHAPSLAVSDALRIGFFESLPFSLTEAQRRVCAQIEDDLRRSRPMARLLQGDVGSGKTVVAALALLSAVDGGFQGVLMAPTEILAEQHFRTLRRLFGGDQLNDTSFTVQVPYLGQRLTVGLLHGGLGTRVKASAQQALAEGEIDIAVGTQALIQEHVELPRLGLAVVDEQHRFGVMQRAALRDKGRNSHLLVMTATPIPRTLALTLYGDLEVSVIDEMPPGRMPVVTKFVAEDQRAQAYQFVRDQIAAGRQAFVICPLVEGSEKLELRAAVEEFDRLRSLEIFAGVEIDLLHGRMKTREKDAIMRGFSEHRSQILVSTAVVEVGIDVPNASVILIEGADRFGLAQLHQFRGRVGRGSEQSYCFLVADHPSPEAAERLHLMETVQDGFELAEADLRLRGPGEYFGTRQSGMPDLRVARLTDVGLLDLTRSEAATILDSAAGLQAEAWTALREEVQRRERRGGEVN